MFTENRIRLRALALPAAILALAALSGCGDDEGDGGGGDAQDVQQVEVAAAGDGTLSGPRQLEAGLNEITLTNNAKRPSDLQLIYVEGQHSRQEVERVFQGAGEGTPFPDWFFGGGGVGTTAPGSSGSVTQNLQPGTYYAFNTGAGGGNLPVIDFKVTGEEGDAELPETDATVTAREYAFEGEGLKAGENQVLFENAGAQPHHIIAVPIIGDASIGDVKSFVKTEKGKPPIAFEQEQSTAVLEGGTSQITTLDLKKPGRYALLCFITDRQGGPPHAAKGMVSEVEVG